MSPTYFVSNIDVAKTNFFKNSLKIYFNLTVIQMSSFGMITSVLFRLKYFNSNLVPGGLKSGMGVSKIHTSHTNREYF